MNIINTIYQHKNIHTHTWSANSSRTFTDYFITNRKLPEVFLDVTVYRGRDIGSNHFLTSYKLRFLLHAKKILHYKIRLLNDESIQWLYKQRIQQKPQEIPESSNIVWDEEHQHHNLTCSR